MRFSLYTGEDTKGTIAEILPRENYIVRRSVNLSKQTHIIASNIDQALLLITPTIHTLSCLYRPFLDYCKAIKPYFDLQ